jgi:hypothetical protein
MLLKYIEPKKEVAFSPVEKEQISQLVEIKSLILNYTKDFGILFKDLESSKLLSKPKMEGIKYNFFSQVQQHISQYNNGRWDFFQKHKQQLPPSLIDNFSVTEEKINSMVDSIGFIGNSSEIKMSNITQYIEDNNLIMFPTSFLREDFKNKNINDIVEQAEKLNPTNKSYIIGTLNSLDLNKIMKHGKFDVSDCIVSKSSETILMSFLFQLPLLQSLNEEIQALKKNNNILQTKINDIQTNIEKFVDHQFKINLSFNSKISDIVNNLQKLNQDNLSYREDKRIANPTYEYIDYSTTLYGEYSTYVSDDSYWGETEKVVKYSYHPTVTAVKAVSQEYQIHHIMHNVQKYDVKLDHNLPLEQAKSIVQNDLKNNFVCVLAKEIYNPKEKVKILCSFGTGYSPVTQAVFAPTVEDPAKKNAIRKGLK